MGCDIHVYPEYVSHIIEGEKEYWSDLGGRWSPGRDYAMFGIIAGVSYGDEHQVVPPRGLPENLGWTAREDAFIRIKDEYADSDGYCTRAQAEGWGGTIYGEETGHPYTDHPDWHTHTWLTADELARCLGTYIVHYGERPYSIEWDALLAALRALEERGHKTRVVIWFDN